MRRSNAAGRRGREASFLAIGLAAALWLAAPVRSYGIGLEVAGPERVLFDQAVDACDSHDLPDAPARAFRNAAGDMALFAPNYQNRAFIGPDLDHLKRDCAVRFAAAGSADPALLDDRTWLQAFHTDNGRDVFALASASFIPYRHDLTCAAGGARTDCWFNGIAALTSHDGGATFAYLGVPPHHLLFPPPEPYRDDVADPPGFMTATNIVSWQGGLYTVLWRRGGDGDTRSHNCLARAPASDPGQWEVWSGSGFVPATRFDGERWQIATTACAAVGPRNQPVIRGVVLAEAAQTFIAVFQDRKRDAAGGEVSGFFYSTSADLLTWSAPELLLALDLKADAAPGEPWAGYPSIIDPASADRNFGTVGKSADLIFVRFQPKGQRSVNRQLVTVPLRVMQ